MTDVAATKKGSFALFANLPVKAKIMAGFALVLAILAILGTTGFTSFRSVGTNCATYETSVDVAQVLSAAAELSAQSEKLKAEVENFLATVRTA